MNSRRYFADGIRGSAEQRDPRPLGGLVMELAADLLTLLSQRDCKEVLTLADHLPGADWWDNHTLGHEALTALESQQHLTSRMKLVASLAKCLLGRRALQFFHIRSAAYVGQKGFYPFAILLSQLSTERTSEVVERAQRWPGPIAEHHYGHLQNYLPKRENLRRLRSHRPIHVLILTSEAVLHSPANPAYLSVVQNRRSKGQGMSGQRLVRVIF